MLFLLNPENKAFLISDDFVLKSYTLIFVETHVSQNGFRLFYLNLSLGIV